MNNCDKLKICARIKISLAIFIMREIFADDCVCERLIKWGWRIQHWLWQFGHLVCHKFQANPQCVIKHQMKKWSFQRMSNGKLDAYSLLNWVRNNDTSSCCHCPPPTPQQESNAPNTTCKSSVEPDSKEKIVTWVQMKRIKIYLYRVCIF